MSCFDIFSFCSHSLFIWLNAQLNFVWFNIGSIVGAQKKRLCVDFIILLGVGFIYLDHNERVKLNDIRFEIYLFVSNLLT